MGHSQEKRLEARAITDVAMEVYDMATHELVGVARLMNLSVAGACVETTANLSGRPNLFIRMLLDNRLVAAPVTVIWERRASNCVEYGLRFGLHSEEMAHVIQTFMRENLKFYKSTDLSLSPPPPGSTPPR
jgi:hypothetical protein